MSAASKNLRAAGPNAAGGGRDGVVPAGATDVSVKLSRADVQLEREQIAQHRVKRRARRPAHRTPRRGGWRSATEAVGSARGYASGIRSAAKRSPSRSNVVHGGCGHIGGALDTLLETPSNGDVLCGRDVRDHRTAKFSDAVRDPQETRAQGRPRRMAAPRGRSLSTTSTSHRAPRRSPAREQEDELRGDDQQPVAVVDHVDLSPMRLIRLPAYATG
jgi:hypothetical protein